MSLRVSFLYFYEKHATKCTIGVTILFPLLTVVGVTLEQDTNCPQYLNEWMIVINTCLILRFVVKRVMENCHETYTLTKFQDLMNVFICVWFTFGNIIVFSSIGCAFATPIVYFSSLLFILGSYATILLPTIIRLSISCCPPRLFQPDYNNYRVPAGNNPANDSRVQEGLNSTHSFYWRKWLEEYNCFEISLDNISNQANALILNEEKATEKINIPTNNDAIATNDNTSFTFREPIQLPVSDQTYETIRTSYCPICLISFNESNASNKNISNEDNMSEIGTSTADLNKTEEQDIENGLQPNENEINSEQTEFNGVPNTHDSEESKEMNSNEVIHQLSQDLKRECVSVPTATTIKDSNIVRYPCPGQHYFHSVCLHKWLQTVTSAVIRPPRRHRSIEQSIELLYQNSMTSQSSPNSNANSGIMYNESALTLDDARRTRRMLMMSNPERAMVNCISCPYCRAPPTLVELPFQTSEKEKHCTEGKI